MRSLAIYLFTFFLASCGGRYPSPDLGADKARLGHVQDATVALVYEPEGGAAMVYCTAAMLEGHLMATALHCVDVFGPGEPVTFVTFADYDEETNTFSTERKGSALVRWVDVPSDIAVLEVTHAPAPYDTLELGDAPQAGDRVHSVGHPSGFHWTYRSGHVSAGRRCGVFLLPEHKQGCYTQANISQYFGNSGGPLVTNDGELVGLTSSGGYTFDMVFFAHITEIKAAVEAVRAGDRHEQVGSPLSS